MQLYHRIRINDSLQPGMKIITRLGMPLLLFLAWSNGINSAWGVIVNDESLATGCAGCHGIRGEGHGALPPISGRPHAALEKALRDFKSDQRTATVMQRIAKGYSDEELARLARYFANRSMR